jgi:Kef-type K+ transport system membrane component KefB/Trk K+ transport system NAD-binding subunit
MIHEICNIFLFAGILVILFRCLKQPMIPAYIIAGIIVSPLFLGLISKAGAISDLSEMAFVIMLFIIGIEMDLDRLKKIGKVVTFGGIAQVVVTFSLGWLFAFLFGMNNITCTYLGLILSFSSTMLVVKVLSDKRDLNSLSGRVSVGILVMQDIMAIFALAILSTNQFGPWDVLKTLTTTGGIILFVVLYARTKILPWLFDFIAKDKETLTVFAIFLMFLVGKYAEKMGLTMGIGAFLVGLALSGLAYRYEIIGELKPLKNSFFGVLFFASLGLQMVPASVAGGSSSLITLAIFYHVVAVQIWLILGLVFLAMIIKPIIVMMIVAFLGYERNTSCSVGISLGQLSEFGLVLAIYGVSQDAISSTLLMVVIISTTLTIILSTYAIQYIHPIVESLEWPSRWLNRLNRLKQAPLSFEPSAQNNFNVAIIGHDQLGKLIAMALKKKGIRYIVVDSNPDVIHELQKEGVPYIFGDVECPEVLEQLDLNEIKTVFSSLPEIRQNALLIEHVKSNPKVNFIAIVNQCEKASTLYKEGAHYVLIMYVLAGQHLEATDEKTTFNLQQLLDADQEELKRIGCLHQHELCGNCNFQNE